MFDLEEYEILMSGFIEVVTEKSQYRPSTIVNYKVILDDYFHNNIINKLEKSDYSEIFSEKRLSLIKRKSNMVRPSLLSFLSFLYDAKFIEEIEHFHLQKNIKAVFATGEIEKEDVVNFLTPNEIRSLFNDRLVFKNDNEEKIVPLICALSCFYMFKQEDVINLKMADVDLVGKRIRNIRRDKENPELVEWLLLNDITVKYIEAYLTYRQTLDLEDDWLLMMENERLANNKINKLFSCFYRIDNSLLFGNKKISQSMLTRSMMLYILISTKGEGLYKILLEQEWNTALDQAFVEYMSIKRTENENELYERYNIDEILPKKKTVLDIGLYSEDKDINLT